MSNFYFEGTRTVIAAPFHVFRSHFEPIIANFCVCVQSRNPFQPLFSDYNLPPSTSASSSNCAYFINKFCAIRHTQFIANNRKKHHFWYNNKKQLECWENSTYVEKNAWKENKWYNSHLGHKCYGQSWCWMWVVFSSVVIWGGTNAGSGAQSSLLLSFLSKKPAKQHHQSSLSFPYSFPQ